MNRLVAVHDTKGDEMYGTSVGPVDAEGRLWELLDTTLRDGGYAVDFQFDAEFVAELMTGLDRTQVRLVEIGHGLGFEAERCGAPPSSLELAQWCELAATRLPTSSWGMFAQPTFSRISTLAALCADGMSFVRVGVEPRRVPEILDYLAKSVELCDHVYLNLMKTSDTPAEELPTFLGDIPAELAGVYVVDSNGSMLPSDVEHYVRVVADVTGAVGFHGHDNLGMANANTLAAAHAGASIVDATLNGIGRGAGNASIESLAGILAVQGDDRYGYQDLARLAELCHSTLDVVRENRRMQVLGGVIGMHSGLFGLVEATCARFGLREAAVMEEAVRIARYEACRADVEVAGRSMALNGALAGSPLATTAAGTEQSAGEVR
jgi:4-hydroxy 2-oxovalerate aldolase